MTLRTIILIVFTCLLAGCALKDPDRRLADIAASVDGEPHFSELKRIDRLMESDPEMVLSELGQIQRGDLTPTESAYFALLYTQAMIRCGVVVSSDSLISEAYRIFGDGDASDLRTRACFYNAKIAYNRGDLTAAMKDATTAYATAKEEESPCWIARSAELIGDIFSDVYNYRLAEPYQYEAAENYLAAGKPTNHRYALCDLASVYLNEGKTNRALHLIDSLRSIVSNDVPVDSALLDYISTAGTYGLFYSGKLEEIASPALTDDINGGYRNTDIGLSIISSRQAYEAGDTAYAFALLTRAYGMPTDERQRIKVRYEMFRQWLTSGKFREAAIMADTLILTQGRIAEDLLKESVTGVQRDFYLDLARYQKQRSANIMRSLVIVVFFAVIITAMLVWIYRLRLKAGRAELEARILTIVRLREHVDRVASENGKLSDALTEKSMAMEEMSKSLESKSAVMEELFRGSWSTLNMLCNEYFNIGEEKATRISVLNNLGKELDKLRSKKNLGNIEAAVDKYLGNIMSLLRRECTFLKEDDFSLMSLLYAGLSVRAICILLDINYKLVYLRKSRISKRIMESDAPHKELFIDRLK